MMEKNKFFRVPSNHTIYRQSCRSLAHSFSFSTCLPSSFVSLLREQSFHTKTEVFSKNHCNCCDCIQPFGRQILVKPLLCCFYSVISFIYRGCSPSSSLQSQNILTFELGLTTFCPIFSPTASIFALFGLRTSWGLLILHLEAELPLKSSLSLL